MRLSVAPPRGPPWFGIWGGIFDHSTELRIRRRELFAAYGHGRVRRTWRAVDLTCAWAEAAAAIRRPRTLRTGGCICLVSCSFLSVVILIDAGDEALFGADVTGQARYRRHVSSNSCQGAVEAKDGEITLARHGREPVSRIALECLRVELRCIFTLWVVLISVHLRCLQ